MERLKIMPKSEVRGVSIFYVNPVLTYEEVLPSVNQYLKDEYNLGKTKQDYIETVHSNNITLDIKCFLEHKESFDNLKRFFNDFYKKGFDLYSFIHGKVEIELLAHALKPYEIKFIPIDIGGYILVFLTLDQLGKISMNSKYNMDLLMEEINKYLNKYEVIEDKIVKKRRF